MFTGDSDSRTDTRSLARTHARSNARTYATTHPRTHAHTPRMIISAFLPLAFIADKCGDDVAVFAGGGFSVLFDHVLALVADRRRLIGCRLIGCLRRLL